MPPDNISAFLLERIAEDEEVAKAATQGSWWAHSGGIMAGVQPVVLEGYDSAGGGQEAVSTWNADHIARHDPARVLAECQAKRRIVEDIRDNYERPGIMVATDGLAWRVLEQLAAAYSDHPEYQQEWRP